MKIQVELEFDEKECGPKWMNRDNLALLLYTERHTDTELLKINKFEEEEVKE